MKHNLITTLILLECWLLFGKPLLADSLRAFITANRVGEKTPLSSNYYPKKGENIELNAVLENVNNNAIKDSDVSWYRIKLKKNSYSNGENIYKDYERIFVSNGRKLDSKTINRLLDDGEGTLRFQVEIKYNGKIISSPGIESFDRLGISNKIYRISFRGNTGVDVVDLAKSFKNLPYIWGSRSSGIGGNDQSPASGHQSENYVGADCADFVSASFRKAGYNIPYMWSLAFASGKYTKTIVEKPVLGEDGNYYFNKKKVEIGNRENQVHLGDIILFSRHIGILSKDEEPLGILSANDKVIHTLFDYPKETNLSETYSSDFSVLRLKDSLKTKP